MKGVFFYSFAIVLFVFTVNGQEKIDFNQKYYFKQGSLITKYKKEVIEYRFASLHDLKEGVIQTVQEFDFDKEERKGNCELIMILKLEVFTGTSIETYYESVTSKCTNQSAIDAVKQFKLILIAQ